MAEKSHPHADDYIPAHQRNAAGRRPRMRGLQAAQIQERYEDLLRHAAWMDVRTDELEEQNQHLREIVDELSAAYEELEKTCSQLRDECDQWRDAIGGNAGSKQADSQLEAAQNQGLGITRNIWARALKDAKLPPACP